MSASADLAKQATIHWDEWVQRVRSGRYSDAQLKATKWYQAGRALEHEVQAPIPLPTHPPGNRCVYFSEVSDHACQRFSELGPGYTALFSADLNLSKPGGKYFVSDAQINQCRRFGGIVGSWCDSSATPYSAAVQMARERNLSFAGGQAEDIAQYLQSVQGGATHVIGEPSNLKQDADVLKDAIRRSYDGSLAFIGEVMRPDPSYSAQGVNITSACFYIDRDAAQGGYIPLSAYSVMPKSLRDGCSIYTGGKMSDEDWATYHSWTQPA